MNDRHESTNAVRVFGQLLMLPITAFVYGIEMIIKTMRGVQQVSNQGIEVIVGSQARTDGLSETQAIPVSAGQPDANPANNVAAATAVTNDITHEEETNLTTNGNCAPEQEKDLHDDMLKLVRYKVLFVRREYEVAFPEQEDLVSDNMDGSAFTAWKIAEFIQNLGIKDSANIPPTHTRVPQKWIDKSYAEEYWSDKDKGGFLTGIPHEDKKYLRVYYEVLERYTREKFKYEEQQIRVLEEIRDKL